MTTKVSKGKQRLTRAQVVFVVTLILAISAYVYMKYRKQKQLEEIDQMYGYAMQQCEKYGGEHGETPIQTEGVFDNRRPTTQHQLFERAALFLGAGLSFVEFNSDYILLPYASGGFKRGGQYYRVGNEMFDYYRVFVTGIEDVRCEGFQRYLQNSDHILRHAKINQEECLALEGFDDPGLLRATYELVVTDEVIREGVPVQWNNLEIMERTSGEVVASFNTFSHCLTATRVHASEGFSYCRGIYGNKRVRPQCPESYAEDASVVTVYEQSAFTNTRNR